MKKLKMVLVFRLILAMFATYVWGDTLDEIVLMSEDPVVVEVRGSFSDGCNREPVLMQTLIEEMAILQIFTAVPPGDMCLEEPSVPFSFTSEIQTPLEDISQIVALLHRGSPKVDDEVMLIDSHILKLNDDNPGGTEEPPDTEEPPETEDPPVTEEPDTLGVSVDITPNTINTKRNGRFVTCKIRLPEGPEGYSVEEIDPESIVLSIHEDAEVEGKIEPTRAVIDEEESTIVLKFESALIIDLCDSQINGFSTVVSLYIKGALSDGTPFEGADDVRLINPVRKNGHQ
jgi:hypothetical protein